MSDHDFYRIIYAFNFSIFAFYISLQLLDLLHSKICSIIRKRDFQKFMASKDVEFQLWKDLQK